jgi:pimeloyl-ACP methyl ester carboxylesterase
VPRLATIAALVGICLTISGPPVRAEHCQRTVEEGAASLGYCLYSGPGPLLVLLSSQVDGMASWPRSFIEALKALAGVLVYDRRGYGDSDPLPPGPVTAETVAADLQGLLQALQVSGPLVLVGHSVGGLYAQYFARNHPEEVAAVVLIDASSSFEPIDDPRFATRGTLKPGTPDYQEDAGYDTSILQTRRSPPLPPIPLVVLTATDHRSPAAFEREWRDVQAQIAAQSPLGHQVIAEGSGHYVQDDQPELVVEAIRQVLSRIRQEEP